MADRKNPIPASWLRAVHISTGSLDAGEALSRLLAEAAEAVGARAAAVLGTDGEPLRAVWGCDEAAIAPLLEPGGVIQRAIAREEEWMEGVLPLSRGDAEQGWGDDFRHLLLAPLRARGLPTGAMALLYDGDASPAPHDCDAATLFGGWISLVVENDRLFEEARAAQQARDHFLTALNHEMRTPATAFVLTADLLGSMTTTDPLPPRLSRLLNDAAAQVSLLVDVLRRVLDLGSLGTRADTERDDIVHPRQLVADLMRRLEPDAKRKNVALALYTPRDLPPLQTDARRLTRILSHLLSNAIKYTPEGRIEVRLERTTHRLGRTRVQPVLAIRVKDTGRGIPPAQLERLFEPFTQVEEGARTDSRSRGVGLGLPLARQLARTLGGDVTLESALGRGTTASLMLPYHQQADA